ncbi:DUF72 domain-containing protein [Oscillatoria sp. FACHB-1406]|uniref:DUF72 domain-containing protein n=1 Tax=Oscillatoria sp. FACHB-1406 TaxID=2692846 RepID=UPI0016895304|nr:DUF72 domain-containing protein [Oscillatoria sp. FACHB-1406]MBD2576610.1 DUF72 domain-containing protein [Oscillatoria sp. FACHB-1406]
MTNSTAKSFYLGCAVWSYKGWVGDFFPPKSPAKDFLSLYAQRLATVEGNTTFYAVPQQATVERWAAETPPGFKFCPKVPKAITHEGLLVPHIEAALSFCDRMAYLGDRLGPIFAQLPPSYNPQQWDDLQEFLTKLPRDRFSFALEVRHRDWFEESNAERLNQLLRELAIARVLLDTRPIYNAPDDPQLASERRKPQLPLQPSVTAEFSLVRFISHPEDEYNCRYLQEWEQWIKSELEGGTQIYFFVHCPIEARSPHIAGSFQHQLESAGVPIPPLPSDRPPQSPDQLSLF